jgi:hypothetical protein
VSNGDPDFLLCCPIHGAKLVRIPKPIAEDIVVCPNCGAGGSYEQVIEKKRSLITRFIPL